MKKNGIEPDWLFIMNFIFILDDVLHDHTKMDFNIHFVQSHDTTKWLYKLI